MKTLLFFNFLFLLFACGVVNDEKKDHTLEKRQYLREPNLVDVLILETSGFKKELVSNGCLKAKRKSILKCELSEELVELNYRNGDWVKQGAIIAELQSDDQRSRLERAKTVLKRAELELADFLLGHGNLALKDTADMSKDLLEIGKVRSGYLDAQHELRAARLELASCKLIAPFSGKIANLGYKIHEQVSLGEEFCTLIDDSAFEVEFGVLETELREVEVGKAAKIVPFSLNMEFKGSVSEINPVVDENGLVTAKALVRNTGDLMEGMNVKIYIQSVVPGQLVVPKEAGVMRQNQEVLFKIVNGRAYWTYVKTLNENSTSFSVVAHPEKGATLAAGDSVIVSGNLNLAHESEVEVRESLYHQ
ncbi:MAG: efflux RND transporter periplasmic adaptor subunit [Cytophagales bacterium]|nr:efflux RND transporter periplasmic adaptor subunit [Cytophagales bacterium]